MGILAGGITQGQAIALILLCAFLFLFILVDIYLVLHLRRKNKKLAKKNDFAFDNEREGTGSAVNKQGDAEESEKNGGEK